MLCCIYTLALPTFRLVAFNRISFGRTNVCSRKDKTIYDIKTSPNFSLSSSYSSFLSCSFRFPLFIPFKYSTPLWIGGDLKVKWAKSFVMVFLIFSHRIKLGGQTTTSLIRVLIPYCFRWVQEWHKFSDFKIVPSARTVLLGTPKWRFRCWMGVKCGVWMFGKMGSITTDFRFSLRCC